MLRRQLRLSTADGRLFSEVDALAGRSRLVILGGPGSGKSWLARRYARNCAQEALQALRDGAEVAEVELPVLATWEAWAHVEGPADEALVAASFEAQLGYRHVGDATMVKRLKRTLVGHHRVLACVDSLDEAGDEHAQQRWSGLTTTLWRVVLTSRPGAWSLLAPRAESKDPSRSVVQVQDLSYPEDVTGLIGAWFADRTQTGEGMIKQIESREDLRRNAVVPLLLTLYCLLADDPAHVALPRRRRELYQAIVRRMHPAR